MPEEVEVNMEKVQSTERSLEERRPPAPERKLPVRAILAGLVVTVLIATGIYFFGPRKPEQTFNRRERPKVVPVTIGTSSMQAVPIEIRTTGNVQPFSVVNVVPQVGGQLIKVHFTQGQMVRKGDLLFEIDPRSYQAALAQAEGNAAKDAAQVRAAQANLARDSANVGQLEANLRKDEASLRYAQVENQRYHKLVQQGAISMEQADQTLTSQATAEAQIAADKKQIENAKAVLAADQAQIETALGTLRADQAIVRNAQLQLEWCRIRAPMTGRTGSLNVYEGNVVTANNPTPLVTIAQVAPIYISFTIPEAYLDQVRRSLAERTLGIQALIEGVKTNLVTGAASFLENTVNTASGTALLRASFDNSDGRLFPGQFVDIVVTMPPDGTSIVVPAAAVQTTQKGSAVYAVRAGHAELVPVTLKRTFGDSAAIEGPIKPGETVVKDGQLQLTPGAAVKIVTTDGEVLQEGPPDAGTASGGAHGEGRRRHRRGEGGGHWRHRGGDQQQQ